LVLSLSTLVILLVYVLHLVLFVAGRQLDIIVVITAPHAGRLAGEKDCSG
jgi:hypothetical protein